MSYGRKAFLIASALLALGGCDKITGLGGDRWSCEEPTDAVTHDKTYDAKRTVKLPGGGRTEMTADCRQLSLPFVGTITFVGIDMVFFDKDDKPLDVDRVGFNDNDQGSLRYTTKDGTEETMGVQLIHSNEIQVRGLNANDAANDITKEMLENDQAREFVNAKFARLEIPLLDGEKPVVDLLPQDEDLRKVIQQCLPSVFQAPAQAPAAPSSTTPAPNPAPTAGAPAPNAPPTPSNGCPAVDQSVLDNEKQSIAADQLTTAVTHDGFIIVPAPLRDGPDASSCVTQVLQPGTFVHIGTMVDGEWLNVTIDQPTGAPALRGYVWGGLIGPGSQSGAPPPAASPAPAQSPANPDAQQQPPPQ